MDKYVFGYQFPVFIRSLRMHGQDDDLSDGQLGASRFADFLILQDLISWTSSD